jgi:methyl-accepting chemotaxis protein
MGASIEEVSENMEILSQSAEETTSSISEMAVSIKQVASNVENLLKGIDQTASSVSEMDASIKQVETNSTETSKISQRVRQDSDEGVRAVQLTIEGINRIHSISEATLALIQNLGRRAMEIGNILNVISEVAEQTNLLALNAAIIAAQAGEYGRGFAVVANEIKNLADRTGISTKESAALITAVQREVQQAVKAMETVSKSVDEGVGLANQAGEVLKKISDSSVSSMNMSMEIARATVEQSKGSRDITDAVTRITEMVQQISNAANEQSKGGDQIMNASERMREITRQVRISINEQAKGSKHITQSIENITEMVNYINKATQEQSRNSGLVVRTLEKINSISNSNADKVSNLDSVIEELIEQSKILKGIVDRFKA